MILHRLVEFGIDPIDYMLIQSIHWKFIPDLKSWVVIYRNIRSH